MINLKITIVLKSGHKEIHKIKIDNWNDYHVLRNLFKNEIGEDTIVEIHQIGLFVNMKDVSIAKIIQYFSVNGGLNEKDV